VKMKRQYLKVLLVLAACIFLFGGCSGGGGAQDEAPELRLVMGMTASYDSLVVTVNAWGKAEANRRVELAFEVQGTVAGIPFDEGEYASHGVTLASLRQGRFKAAHESAEASYEDAKRNLSRMEKLVEENVVSDEERERAEIAVAAAHAMFQSTTEDLRGSVISAPFSGLVTTRYCELGEVTSPGKPAFVFMEMDPILINIELSDTDVSKVIEGQPAAVRLDAYPERSFEGTVSSVAVAAHEQGGGFKVEIKIANPDLAIKPGMAAEVNVTIKTVARSIVLPIESIVYNAGVPYVYVVSGGVAKKRRLDVAAQAGTRVAVGGLAAGDTVVVAGNRFLTDGEAIRVSIEK
jgi:membrane fusion protein (multidrug efflux system)